MRIGEIVKRKRNKSKLFFSNKENQVKYMEQLFVKFKLSTLDDWLQISQKKIILNRGGNLLKYYSNDIKKVLNEIYPNYPFAFENKKINANEYFKVINNQQVFMDNLFKKFELNNMEDWLNISRRKISNEGGKSLLYYYYSNDLKKLLQTIYSNFPWLFEDLKINYSIEYFKSFENQKKFMEKLFFKLKLNSIEDWHKISKRKIIKNRGKNLIYYFYSNDLKKLLTTIYPNFAWEFDDKIHSKKIAPADQFFSLQSQRQFMDNLFIKLNLKTINEWENKRSKIQSNGGTLLLSKYPKYSDFLSTIYPNFPWNFDQFITRKNSLKYFQLIENQRQFMDDLFIKSKLNSLDDWLNISKQSIIDRGGKWLFSIYEQNMNSLLSSIYPHHNWNISKYRSNSNQYFRSIENQREFMDELFIKLKLKSKEDWLKVTKSSIIKKGGFSILSYYSHDFSLLLSSIYPNFNWNFSHLKINSNLYFITLENQILFMEKLFKEYQFTSFDDWRKITRNRLKESGGFSLLSFYSNDLFLLFTSIYPNYPWKMENFELNLDFIENQKKLIENIFLKLKLNNLDEWIKVTRNKFIKNGGKRLLDIYSNDFKLMLSTIYPDHSWQFQNKKMKFKPNFYYFRSNEFLQKKLAYLKEKYVIYSKKDWYRLPLKYDEINLYQALKFIYPHEHWEKRLFTIRTKKYNQRNLFVLTQQLFSSLLLIENYRHPYLVCANNQLHLEYDIYIPSLNIAFEYQGQHHFDDIPSGFSHVELYRSRDREKEELSEKQQIKLITIPYWWDQSSTSLRSTIHLDGLNFEKNVNSILV